MIAAPLPVSPEAVAAVAAAVVRLRGRRDADPWAAQRRPNQTPPDGDWRTWLVLAGRGFGKTRTAAEWAREEVMAGRARRVALVAPTAADVRDVLVEGESGLLAVCERYGFRPLYEPSKRRLTFPNGAIATTYSADEPDRLRGPQHDLAVCDEVAAWRRPEAFDMLQFGLRLGSDPRQIVTTTPRPVPLLKRLLADPTTAVTRGSTYDNRGNLAPAFLAQIVARYEGTRLGRQELLGEILDDVPGALWTLATIDAHRVAEAPALDTLTRIVIGVDPAASAGEESAETGIVVVGRDWRGDGYVLEDASLRGSPFEWGRAVVAAYDRWRADAIVAEANQGGAMVAATIQAIWDAAPVTLVHASRGKLTRAEPVSALYEQGRVHHVGAFPALEDQMTTYDGSGASPDRMDALVWGFTDVLVGAAPAEIDPAVAAAFEGLPT